MRHGKADKVGSGYRARSSRVEAPSRGMIQVQVQLYPYTLEAGQKCLGRTNPGSRWRESWGCTGPGARTGLSAFWCACAPLEPIRPCACRLQAPAHVGIDPAKPANKAAAAARHVAACSRVSIHIRREHVGHFPPMLHCSYCMLQTYVSHIRWLAHNILRFVYRV